MLPVSLDCSFLIAPLVFYCVYLIKDSTKMALSIAIFNYCEPDLAEINSFNNIICVGHHHTQVSTT
jgi:hypothetical protein